jgi:hypothetical protein
MADDPGKSYRDKLNEAADKAIKWAKDKVNIPEDIKGFEDYFLNTRSSPDDNWWGNPYIKESDPPGRSLDNRNRPQSHGRRMSTLMPSSRSVRQAYDFRPPSSKDIAEMDQAKLQEFKDNLSAQELKAIAKDLNLDLSDVASLPRTAIRELVRKYGPSSRPFPEDVQDQFQTGWDYDREQAAFDEHGWVPSALTPQQERELYLKYRKPRMQEFEHSRKRAARRAWDKHKFKEAYEEGQRLNKERDDLKTKQHQNQRSNLYSGGQKDVGDDVLHKIYPEKGRFEPSSDNPGGQTWQKGKDERKKEIQQRNEAKAVEEGAGLSPIHPRRERD